MRFHTTYGLTAGRSRRVAKKQTEKLVYITREDGGDGVFYPLVHESISEAYSNSSGIPVTVEVYKLLKTVSVTREEIYNEEVI